MTEPDFNREFWKFADFMDEREERLLIASYDPGLVAVVEHITTGSGDVANMDYQTVLEALGNDHGLDPEAVAEVFEMCEARIATGQEYEQA